MPRIMRSQLPALIPVHASPVRIELSDAERDKLADAIGASLAPNTRRAYATQLKLFESWLDAKGFPQPPWRMQASMRKPVAEEVILLWLKERADAGASRSGLNVGYCTLLKAHAVCELAFEPSNRFKATLAGIRRGIVREERQVAPLRGDLLAAVLDGLGSSVADAREGAMLALLYACALRRSELVGLDFEVRGSGDGVLRLTDEAIEVVLFRSKTETSGRAAPIQVPVEANPKAASAIARWLAVAAINRGAPLFLRFNRGGGLGKRMSDGGVALAVKAALQRHFLKSGLSPEDAKALAATYAGHSGRVGFVVSAKEANASDTDVAVTTRHKSLAMIGRYGKQAEQLKRAVHRIKGVGV